MSVKSALRALSAREVTLEELEEYQRQVRHETNDRGACILMATNVELALTTAIFRTVDWNPKTRGELTDDAGPIHTFAQKIRLGRALRIYGDDTHHNLDHIRHIRNAFAHSHAPISFETKEIQDAVAILRDLPASPPVGVAAYAELQTREKTIRNAFARTCDITAHNLMVWAYFDALYRPLSAEGLPLARKRLP